MPLRLESSPVWSQRTKWPSLEMCISFLYFEEAWWPVAAGAGAAASVGVEWVAVFFFLYGHGCEVRFPSPASPSLAVNSAHFEIRRLGYSSLEMLPAVPLLSERSQIKTSLEGISE